MRIFQRKIRLLYNNFIIIQDFQKENSIFLWYFAHLFVPLHHQIIVELKIQTMDNLQNIQNLIYEVRGVKVMLDKDLAGLYHVTTGNLNKAVKRNIRRFPSDFMFQLTKEEWDSLRFQIGILEVGRCNYTKFLPYALLAGPTGAIHLKRSLKVLLY